MIDEKKIAKNQIAQIQTIVNHYMHSNELPLSSQSTIHQAFRSTTPHSYAGYVLLERAGHYNVIRQVGKAMTRVIDHSSQYTKDFFYETDKMLTGFRCHDDLEHILKVVYTRFFPLKQGFENIVHAFDGAAVASALRNYDGIVGEYNHVAQAMQDIASRSKTSSPVFAFANALNQQKILDIKKKLEHHPSRHVVSKSVIDCAQITLNPHITSYVADIGYRHIDEAAMHLIMDVLISQAKLSNNPTEYLRRTLSRYDSPQATATSRRKAHSQTSAASRTLKPAA